MDKIPSLGDPDVGALEEATERAKNLIPWLADPKECEECGRYCDATRAYDARTAAFYPNGRRPVWECPECETLYYRERV